MQRNWQKIGDCGEDYESWPEKTGLQAANGPVSVILLPQPGIRLISRPATAPSPRVGFFASASGTDGRASAYSDWNC